VEFAKGCLPLKKYISKTIFFSKIKIMTVILGKKSCLTDMENPKWAI